MRIRRVWLAALLVAGFVRPARAGDPGPDLEGRAAEVISAYDGKAQSRLSEMARDENPDAWFVVDELLARKRKDVAGGFAAAREGSDAKALRAFAQRGLVEPAEARPKLASAEERLAAEEWEKALDLLPEADGIPDGVLRTRWHLARARGFEGAARWQDQATALRIAARSAQKVEWMSGALDCWMEASDV